MAENKLIEKIRRLTDKRLILLYVLSQINTPLTLERIIYVACGNEWMNYFDLSEAIVELTDSELLTAISDPDGTLFVISPSGRDALDEFMNRIPYSLRGEIETFCHNNIRKIRMASQNLSSIKKLDNGKWLVKLWVEDNGEKQISLNIVCSSHSFANDLSNRWVDRAAELYHGLIEGLTKD